jgi:hypothetical protein
MTNATNNCLTVNNSIGQMTSAHETGNKLIPISGHNGKKAVSARLTELLTVLIQKS